VQVSARDAGAAGGQAWAETGIATFLTGWQDIVGLSSSASKRHGTPAAALPPASMSAWIRLLSQPQSVAVHLGGRQQDWSHDTSPRLISELDRYLTYEGSFRERVCCLLLHNVQADVVSGVGLTWPVICNVVLARYSSQHLLKARN
jgi:hypothetical protein